MDIWVTLEHNESLIKVVIEEEICETLKGMHPDKAPSLEGFPTFFQQF